MGFIGWAVIASSDTEGPKQRLEASGECVTIYVAKLVISDIILTLSSVI